MATKARPAPTRPQLTAILPSDQTPGRSVTVGDFVIEQIKAGVDPANAAGTVGVTPGEFMAWMREGTLGLGKLNSGVDWRLFTRDQQDFTLFADKVIRARSAHIARLSITSEQVARGGVERRSSRTKTVNGQVVEIIETVERTLPDGDMLRWKLEKLEPAVYGPKATLNVTVADLTDTSDVADVVERRMREIAASLRARHADAIETNASE